MNAINWFYPKRSSLVEIEGDFTPNLMIIDDKMVVFGAYNWADPESIGSSFVVQGEGALDFIQRFNSRYIYNK